MAYGSFPDLTLLSLITLGIAFLIAGLSKARNRVAFIDALHHHWLLPAGLSRLLGRLLPYSEVALGLSLLVGMTPRASAVTSLLFLSAFTAMMSWKLVRGYHGIPCGCFGASSSSRLGWGPLVRNIVLMILAGILYAQTSSLFTNFGPVLPTNGFDISQNGVGLVVSFLGSCSILLMLAVLEQILAISHGGRHKAL